MDRQGKISAGATAPRNTTHLGKSREGTVLPAGSEPGKFCLRDDIVRKPPLANLDGARYWLLDSYENSSSGLGEITKVLPLHFHTDGEHRVGIIEGRAKVRVGEETHVMKAGDYVRIPRGTVHRFECVSEEPVWFTTFDTPSMDPDNFFWVEPAPGSCPLCSK